MYIFMFKHHVLCKKHEGTTARTSALSPCVSATLHLLQHDVLASLFMHLCGDPPERNDILAGSGRTQKKCSFQQDSLLNLVDHVDSVQTAEQGQGGERKLKQQYY